MESVDQTSHRYERSAIGATPTGENKTQFRVWAPNCKRVEVVIETDQRKRIHELQRHPDHYFAGVIDEVGPGDRYTYRLDEGALRPDPASRFQPEGVHGPSQIIDPDHYQWQDQAWRGISKSNLIIYELHVGTFTEEGTFLAARQRLAELVELGITAVELMPVVQTPGRWNWGYDGVNFFAVRNTLGTPDDFKSLIDACHELGLAVILDVVYNHVGPEGNYLHEFGHYRSRKHHTPWGDAFNFDSRQRRHVRQFVISNALFWLDEYHLDGLRLDAVHFMRDDNSPHILTELRRAVTQFQNSSGRQLHLIAEANIYDHELLTNDPSSPAAYDAIWCDDIMHSLYSVATPQTMVTHRHYGGREDLAEALHHGFIYAMPDATRVTPELRQQLHGNGDKRYLSSLVVGLQTHDSVGNHPLGRRFHQLTSSEIQKAGAALVLLMPTIPLIFMGEEHASTSPFMFFVDFEDPRLRKAVHRGRAREYPQHVRESAVSPIKDRAFYDSKSTTTGDDASMCQWYRSLLDSRKQWQADGVLHPDNLQVRVEQELSVYSLHYRDGANAERFVVVRIDAPHLNAPPARMHVQGHIILDSGASATEFEGETRLDTSRAIIGHGTCSLRPDDA